MARIIRCSRQQASDWISWAVSQVEGDSTRFSGISARKGGISTAIEAGVDEAILYLHPGPAARGTRASCPLHVTGIAAISAA